MAIIQCPECNEKISTTAQQCVHCGVKIAVCPECETVYTEHPNRCSECGYVFKEYANTAQKSEEFKGTAIELKRKWKNEKPLIGVLEYFDTGCVLLFLLFFGIAALRLFSWHGNLANLEFGSSNQVLQSIKTLSVLCAIFSVLERVFNDVKPTVTGLLLSSWASVKGIDLVEVLRTSFSADLRQSVEKQKQEIAACSIMTVHAAAISHDPTAKSKRIFNHALHAIIQIVAVVFICSFVMQNVEIYMAAELGKSDILNIPGWSAALVKDVWKLIVGICIMVVGRLFKGITAGKHENQNDAWIKKTMPEHFKTYTKHILKSIE